MTFARRRGWVVAAATVLALAAAAAAPGSSDLNPTTLPADDGTARFLDSTGEHPGAPDINVVTVASDDSGLVTFVITFSNRTVGGPLERFFIDIDADLDRATGSPSGRLDHGIDVASWGTRLWKYDAMFEDWYLKGSPSLRSEWAPSTLTVRINAGELGITSAFDFRVIADANPSDATAGFDVAPDGYDPLWRYELRAAAAPIGPAVKIVSLDCTPEPAVRGGRMTAIAFAVLTRGEDRQPLPPSATVVWRAKFGNVALRPLKVGRGSSPVTLRSTWRLPKGVKASVVRVTVTVTVDRSTATRTHAHRVR